MPTETATMPDWPKLWEREKTLIPTVGEGAMMGRCGFCGPARVLVKRLGEVGHQTVPDEIAAALCRDAAVKFILASGGVIHGGYPASVSYAGRRHGPIAVSEDQKSGRSDIDSTLFIGCEAILDARDAAKAGGA